MHSGAGGSRQLNCQNASDAGLRLLRMSQVLSMRWIQQFWGSTDRLTSISRVMQSRKGTHYEPLPYNSITR